MQFRRLPDDNAQIGFLYIIGIGDFSQCFFWNHAAFFLLHLRQKLLKSLLIVRRPLTLVKRDGFLQMPFSILHTRPLPLFQMYLNHMLRRPPVALTRPVRNAGALHRFGCFLFYLYYTKKMGKVQSQSSGFRGNAAIFIPL